LSRGGRRMKLGKWMVSGSSERKVGSRSISFFEQKIV